MSDQLAANATAPVTVDRHEVLLNQLNSQLNSVLEQTGRVFAALGNNPKSHPTAQVTKLKHVIPVATDRFHEALDQLESELKLAQAVMRRDLAVHRERSNPQASHPTQPEQVPANDASAPGNEIEIASAAEPAPANQHTDVAQAGAHDPGPEQTEDIIMEDPSEEDDQKPVPVMSFDELIADDKPSVPTPPLAESKPSVAAHTLPATEPSKPPAATQPSTDDTKAPDDPTVDDDKAPDNNNDLDSLFNDTMSAGGTAVEGQEFNFDQDGSNGIDFGSFGANFDANGSDNDNISSLLPGLEDYANTQPNNDGADVDLDTLFGVGDANGMNSQGAGEQHDSTFDDLMDLANFDGMDGGAGGDGNNNANNADFDFDSLFN